MSGERPRQGLRVPWSPSQSLCRERGRSPRAASCQQALQPGKTLLVSKGNHRQLRASPGPSTERVSLLTRGRCSFRLAVQKI